MKPIWVVIAAAVATSLVGCSMPNAVRRGPIGSVPSLESCASVADENARRGHPNFEIDGTGGVEARAIFYRARLHASNGVSDRQLAMWANRGEDPLPTPSLDQSIQSSILLRCEAEFEAREAILPVGEQEAAETCYVVATFIPSPELTNLIARRYNLNEGRLGSISRASARQSRDADDTFFYLDALGNALKTEPLDHTADRCRRRFMTPY